MADRYTIERVVFASGERFLLLRHGPMRMPSFDVTAFTLSEFRQVNAASATLEQVVRSMKVLALFCEKEKLDLDERMHEGRFLEMGEVDALVEWCGRMLADMEAIVETELKTRPSRRAKVHSLESHRRRANKPSTQVDRDSAAIRIRYIANFLSWKADRYLLVLPAGNPVRPALVSAKDTVLGALRARIPAASGRNSDALKDPRQRA